MTEQRKEVASGNRIVISTITYAEMRYGQIGKKASLKLGLAIDAFVRRLDGVLPWDAATVDNALATGCVLVTNNTREFSRVAGLPYEDWAH